jgi:hypothetical protein
LFITTPEEALTWTSPAPTLIICTTEPTGKLLIASLGTRIVDVPALAVISRVAYLWVVASSVKPVDAVKYSSGKKVFDDRVTEAEASNPTLPDNAVLPERVAEDIVGLKERTIELEPVIPLPKSIAAICKPFMCIAPTFRIPRVPEKTSEVFVAPVRKVNLPSESS